MQELSFQVNSYHNVRLTEDLLGETIDTSFDYHFHEGTEGLFQLEPITITFISNTYQSTKCVLNKIIFNLVVENEHQVDMNPPKITAINLKRDTSSGHWLLALDIDDVSAVRLFEPNDDFVPHFTLKNIDTLEEHLCFNRNLRLAQDSYVVDLFISRTNDSLIHLPAGNYRLLGLNRSDIFGNFQYDVANELNFTATDSFYCRDQQ